MNPNKRLLVRLSPDDHAWLLTQAEDEGVDPQTMVALVIHRLRLGRQPVPVNTRPVSLLASTRMRDFSAKGLEIRR